MEDKSRDRNNITVNVHNNLSNDTDVVSTNNNSNKNENTNTNVNTNIGRFRFFTYFFGIILLIISGFKLVDIVEGFFESKRTAQSKERYSYRGGYMNGNSFLEYKFNDNLEKQKFYGAKLVDAVKIDGNVILLYSKNGLNKDTVVIGDLKTVTELMDDNMLVANKIIRLNSDYLLFAEKSNTRTVVKYEYKYGNYFSEIKNGMQLNGYQLNYSIYDPNLGNVLFYNKMGCQSIRTINGETINKMKNKNYSSTGLKLLNFWCDDGCYGIYGSIECANSMILNNVEFISKDYDGNISRKELVEFIENYSGSDGFDKIYVDGRSILGRKVKVEEKL